MFCPNCGKEMHEGAQFCSGCGAKIDCAAVTGAISFREQGIPSADVDAEVAGHHAPESAFNSSETAFMPPVAAGGAAGVAARSGYAQPAGAPDSLAPYETSVMDPVAAAGVYGDQAIGAGRASAHAAQAAQYALEKTSMMNPVMDEGDPYAPQMPGPMRVDANPDKQSMRRASKDAKKAAKAAQAAKPVSPEQSSKKKRTVIIVVVAVIVVLVVAGIVGFNLKSASDAAALQEEIAGVTAGLEEKVNAIPTDSTERAVQLANYNQLSQLRATFEDAQSSGALKLSNGSACDLTEVYALIDQRQSEIRDWFAADYEARLASATLPDGASADNTTREAAEAAQAIIEDLRVDMKNEIAIWGNDTKDGSRYAKLVASIDAQATRLEGVLALITAAEEKAAAEAAAKAAEEAAKAARTYECDYFTVTVPESWAGSWKVAEGEWGPYAQVTNAAYAAVFSMDNPNAGTSGQTDGWGTCIVVLKAGESTPASATSFGGDYLGTTSSGNRVYKRQYLSDFKSFFATPLGTSSTSLAIMTLK